VVLLGAQNNVLTTYLRGTKRKKDGETMSKRVRWLLPVLLLLGSCATTYTHPTKGPSQFERDRAACESIARKTLAAKGVT